MILEGKYRKFTKYAVLQKSQNIDKSIVFTLIWKELALDYLRFFRKMKF